MLEMDASEPTGSEADSMGAATPCAADSTSAGSEPLCAAEGPVAGEGVGSASTAAAGALRQGLSRSSPLGAGRREIVMRLDSDGRFLYISPNVREVTGIEASQFIGKTPHELGLPPAMCDYHMSSVLRVVATAAPFEEEFTFDSSRGPLVLEWRLFPEFAAGGEATAIIGTLRDVTAQRRAEYDLRASEERYRQLFQESISGLALLDITLDRRGRPRDCRFLEANPAFERLVGRRREEILGRTMRQVMPGFAAEAIDRCGRVALTGEPTQFRGYSERLGRHFEVRAYRPQAGQVAAHFHDVTEAARSEARMRSLLGISQYRGGDLLGYALAEAIALTESAVGYVYGYDEDGQQLTISTWSGRAARSGDAPEPPMTLDLDASGPWGDAVRQRRAIVANDCAADGQAACGPQGSAELQRLLVVPVLAGSSAGVTAVVGVANKQVPYDEADALLLTLLIDIVSRVLDRQAVEKALVHSRDMMRYVIEHLRGAVAVLDRDLRYVYVSQRWLDDYGVKDKEVIGRRHYDLFPDLPQKWRDVHARGLAGEVTSSESEPFEMADGSVTWNRWECRPWHEADGSIGGIILYSEDTTERVVAEQALRESEEKFALAFRTAPYAITITRWSDGSLVDVNDAFTTLSGYTREEALENSSIGLALWVNPEDRSRVLAQLARGEKVASQEMQFRRKDGSVMSGLFSAEVIRFRAEPYILSSTNDITEYKRAEAERVALQAQLLQAQKMESVGRLAGGVAHDFNNLLTAISGYAEMASTALDGNPAARQDLEEVMRSAERARNLTRQLLAFSRRQELQMRPVDLNVVVTDLARMLRRLIGEDIELELALAPGPAPVRADVSQIEQVLANLSVNARDAMPSGGRIVISTTNLDLDADAAAERGLTPGRYVRLVVADNGQGMTDGVKTHLFEPFFTTKEAGKGTGLGLATVYGIVKQHGGEVSVDSDVGKGTAVSVYLPALGREPIDDARPGADQAARGGREVILLAEDEEVVREITRRVLERLGYRVLEAADGEQALQLVADGAVVPDLLITDLVMPRMGGLELAHRLRDSVPGLRVLYTSGYTEETRALSDATASGDSYLPKPYTAAALGTRVRAILDGQH